MNNKGQSILISHAIIVSFGIFMVFVVVTTFTNLRADFQNFTAANEIDQLCLILKSSAEKVAYTDNYISPSGAVSEITVKLPDRIAAIPYNVRFVNGTVAIETQSPRFTTNCTIGLDINYSGFTTGGLTTVVFNNTGQGLLEMRAA
jgi:hypothetical protein